MNEHFEHRQLRLDAQLHRVRILIGKFQLVGGVDLGVELDRLHRRPLQPQRLRAIAALAGALDLQSAGQRLGIVLQRDDPLHPRRLRIDQHDAAFEQFR